MNNHDHGEHGIEVKLTAKIALIDSGTPKTAVADVLRISLHDAIIEVSHSLQHGEKIGFLIEGPGEELSELFSKTGMATSSFKAIKTQAVVDELLESDSDSDAMRLKIRFVGNMRFIESGALAEAD